MIALGFVGEGAASLLAQAMLVENVLMIPLALALLAGAGPTGRLKALKVLRGVAANPIMLALLAALWLTPGIDGDGDGLVGDNAVPGTEGLVWGTSGGTGRPQSGQMGGGVWVIGAASDTERVWSRMA